MPRMRRFLHFGIPVDVRACKYFRHLFPAGRAGPAGIAWGHAHEFWGARFVKVFVFDLLAYGEQLDHLRGKDGLPYPLAKQYFKPDVAMRTYNEHLQAWEEIDRLGFDGIGFNEHHCSP